MARKGVPPSVPEAEPPGLSRQQRTIYGLVRQGKTVRGIADEIGTSEPTVRSQLKRIRGIQNKAEGSPRQGVKSVPFWQALTADDVDFLTPMQKRVVALRKAGHSNAEVARTLGLAEGTIRTHLHEAKARLTAWPRSVPESAKEEPSKEE